LPAVEIDPARVHTNILVFRLRSEKVPGDAAVAPSQRFVNGMQERGVLLGAFGATDVRMVTHYEIDDHAVEATLRAARSVLG
jgi:threonine aldolase